MGSLLNEILGGQNSTAVIGLILIAVGIVQHITASRAESKKIAALGGHAAAVVSTWVPFAADFVVSSMRHSMIYQDLAFWSKTFLKWGKPERPWTFEITIFGHRTIHTVDEDNIQAVLGTNFHDYGKGSEFNKIFHEFLGDNVFSTDGQKWQESRRLVRQQLTKSRVSDLVKFETHVQALLPLLSSSPRVDVKNLFLRLTLDVTTDYLLGGSVHSLQKPGHTFAKAFTEVQRVQALMSRAGPLMYFIRKGTFREGLRVMNDFIQPFIDRALALPPEELDKHMRGQDYTFLHALASFNPDQKILRDQIVGVLLAGNDSTAFAMSWMFYHFARRPHIVERLRAEILKQVGKNAPTYEDLRAMTYLSNCIKEIMRLYPAIPFNVRTSTKDTTLPRGGGPDGTFPMAVLKGTAVTYSPLVLHRRADIYPTSDDFPDYREFAPERWENWTPQPWTYIPFNGGPRVCIGQDFAMTEIAYATVRILQRYPRIECVMDQEPGLKSSLLLSPSTSIDLVFHAE